MKQNLKKRIVSALLVLVMVVMLVPFGAIDIAAYTVDDYNAYGSMITNDYLTFGFNGNNFGYHTTGGDPNSATDDNQRLLYGSANGGTSKTILNINGAVHQFTSLSAMVSDDGKSLYATNTYGDVLVEQFITFSYNTTTQREDAVEIKYVITNNGASDATAGGRIFFDTMLGSNDSAPFRIPGRQDGLTSEAEYVGDEIPQTWQAFNSLSSPSVISSGTFYNNVSERPDKVQFIRYGSAYDNVWNCNISNSSFGDSAVNIYYNPITLASGESRTFKTYYGLSAFVGAAPDPEPPVVPDVPVAEYVDFGISAIVPAELLEDFESNTYVGNPFTFNGWLVNNGNVSATNVQATISLPNGLSLNGQSPTVSVSELAPGDNLNLYWSITAAEHYVDTTHQYQITVTADNADAETYTYSLYLPALEAPVHIHTPGEWFVYSEPTCTEPGMNYTVCSECGNIADTEYVAPLGHSYVVYDEFMPTCVTDGYIYFECTNPGCDSNKSQITIAPGHSFGDDNVCDACGYERVVHTHTYAVTVVAPTCTSMGYTEYVCTSCAYYYRADYIEQLTHAWGSGVITVEKGCTTDGLKTYTCENCAATMTEILPKGHEWSEDIVTEATCTEDGEVIKTCQACGVTHIEVIPAAHSWNEGTVLVQPTCNTTGVKQCVCTVCGTTESFEIDELGHIYVNGVCTRCGIGFIEDITDDPDHPEYGMYFEIDDIVSNYGPDIINEYGVLLDYNEGANIEKVAVYLTQDGTMWRRCIACTGTGITYATYVPYLSYSEDIKYTGLNSPWINIFRLSENGDGIWCYSDYATIGVNLADSQGNLLLSLYDIGQAGSETRIFDDLGEMIAWLNGGANPDCQHQTGDWVIEREPTAVSEGYKVKRCIYCGTVIETESISAVGIPTSRVESALDYVEIDEEITFTVIIENCNIADALAAIPQFNSDIFELVSAEWSVIGAISDVDLETNRAVIAFDGYTDVNGIVFTFTLRANALTAYTPVGCRIMAETEDGIIELRVQNKYVSVIRCAHEVTECVVTDDTYHSVVCIDCGYTIMLEHVYDSVCDDTCNDCGYVRVAPHSYSVEWQSDDSCHWHECELCGASDTPVLHTLTTLNGDLDADGDLDSDDSVYLVYHIFFGNSHYPITHICVECSHIGYYEILLDFNCDGTVSSEDAIYLLYHIYYPSFYPLP